MVGPLVDERMRVLGLNQTSLSALTKNELRQNYISQVIRGEISVPLGRKAELLREHLNISREEWYRAAKMIEEEADEERLPSPLDEVIAILEADPEVGPQIAEIKRTQTPRVYREAVEALAEAWRANAKMMFRTFRAGQEARSQ